MSDLQITPQGTIAIGAAVTSGTDDAVLFIDPAGVLAQDPTHFSYNKAMPTLTLADADLIITGSTPGMGHITAQPAASISNPLYAMVVDRSTTNLVVNPSFETNTTSWSAGGGGAISRITTDAAQGDACLEVSMAATAGYAQYTVTGLSIGQRYIVSAFAKNVSGSTTVAIIFATSGGSGSFFIPSTTKWKRITSSFTASATSEILRFGSAGVTTMTYRLDCVQVELASSSTQLGSTYCDGSMGLGYAWTGTAHASTSTRAGGFHVIAPSSSGTTSFAIDANGSIQGGQGYVFNSGHAMLGNSTYVFTNQLATLNATTSADSSLAAVLKINNTGDGSALVVSSSTTTDIGFIVSTQSLTSGTAMSIAINSDKTNFSGEYFKFTAKSATDQGDWRWSKIRHQIGTQNENLNKNIQWYSGGVFSKSNSSQAGTISQSGTTVTGVGTSFASSMIGRIFVPATGSETLITAVASTTSMTVQTSQTIAAGTAWSLASTQYSPPMLFLERGHTDHRVDKKTGLVDSLFFDEFGNLQQHLSGVTAGSSTLTTTINTSAFTTAANDANIVAGRWIHANGLAPIQVLSYSGTSGTFRGAASASVAAIAYRIRTTDFNYPSSATDSLNRPINICEYGSTADLTFSSSTTEKSIFTDAAPSTTAAALPILLGGKSLIDRSLRILVYGTITGGNTKQLKIRIYLGSTVVVTNTTAVTLASASTFNFFLSGHISNLNSTAVQRSAFLFSAATDAAAPTTATFPARGTSTVDTTADQPLDISFDFDTAAGAATIEKIKIYWE